MYKKVMVTLDGSAIAEQALPHAQALAGAFGAKLILLRVDTPIPYLPRERYPQELERIARDYLESVAAGLAKTGLDVDIDVEYGEASSTILDYAETHRVDLIVMCTHGYSGFSHLVYGSVTHKVLNGADVPVVVVRAKQP